MPTYTKTWDETSPAGSRALSLGDDDIRDFKYAIRERFATDHYAYADETAMTDVGYHKIIHLMVQTVVTQLANAGCLYTKDVSAKAELHFKDEDGNEIQLTSGGVLKDTVLAKTGDWMLSSVTTARTGWTNVSATYSNKFIRINATPLTTGGADTHTHAAGSYAGPSHTHTGTTSYLNNQRNGTFGTYLEYPNDWDTNPQLDHKHTFTSDAGGTGAITGSSASGDNVPAYVQTVIFQKD